MLIKIPKSFYMTSQKYRYKRFVNFSNEIPLNAIQLYALNVIIIYNNHHFIDNMSGKLYIDIKYTQIIKIIINTTMWIKWTKDGII